MFVSIYESFYALCIYKCMYVYTLAYLYTDMMCASSIYIHMWLFVHVLCQREEGSSSLKCIMDEQGGGNLYMEVNFFEW